MASTAFANDADVREVFAVALTAFAFECGDGWTATVTRDNLPLLWSAFADAATEYNVMHVTSVVSTWVALEAESVSAGKALRHVVKLACRTAGERYIPNGAGYCIALDC
jgi:hypothetical protein